MDYKKRIIMVLVFTLVIPTTLSRVSDFNPSIDNWYAVSEWEIEFCREWGGSEQGGINQGATSKTPIALSQLTIALQGEKIEYNIENQSTLYKSSWYVEPVSDELNYKIYLTGDGKQEIGSGTAKNTAAGFGYYANYINKSFTHVRLEYPGNYLEVPIVS